mmetsp:Transcript_102441/g.264898  ORF Transcript_102441/g.264898 Transcript_102441/m.264898 type:complete len:232 (+) Transcript_102441:1081-1776(+)
MRSWTAATAFSMVSTAAVVAFWTVMLRIPGTLAVILCLALFREFFHSGNFCMAWSICAMAWICDVLTAIATAFLVMSSTSVGIERICVMTSSSCMSMLAMPCSTPSTLSCSSFFAVWAQASKDWTIISGITSRLSMAVSVFMAPGTSERIFARSSSMVSSTFSAMVVPLRCSSSLTWVVISSIAASAVVRCLVFCDVAFDRFFWICARSASDLRYVPSRPAPCSSNAAIVD